MISIVVPIFNMEQYLPRCMKRLLNQSGKYEIILVDDGSTDDSAKLCDEYARKYTHLVRVIHKRNGGLSSARNVGIDSARGEFVIFPDPDDWVEPNFILKLTELQEKYQPDLLCVGHYIEFDTFSIVANDKATFRLMDKKEAQRALLISPCMNGFAWNKLYRLELIQSRRLRFLDEVGKTEDLDFTFRYLNYCGRIAFSPEDRLYHYYQRSGAATHSIFTRKDIASIQTFEKIISVSRDKEMISAAEEAICNWSINLIWNYQNSHLQDSEILKQLRQYLRKYLRIYCKSERYSIERKIQAILAYCFPKLYASIKNRCGCEK